MIEGLFCHQLYLSSRKGGFRTSRLDQRSPSSERLIPISHENRTTIMLDAYLRKGAALPTEPALDGRRRVIEDAITSTLLTPVRFMHSQDAIRVLSLLAGVEFEKPNACELRLWRKFDSVLTTLNANSVEPDVVADLRYQDRVHRIVIEVKWDDVLHLNQVQSQLASTAADIETPSSVRHFSLVKFADDEVLRFKATTVRQWSEVLKDLKQVAGEANQTVAPDALASWCQDAAKLLQRLGIGSFSGLAVLPLVPINRYSDGAVTLRKFGWADLNPVRHLARHINLRKG